MPKKFCRICLKAVKKRANAESFENKHDNLAYSAIFKTLTNITYNHKTEPNLICPPCKARLIGFYTFLKLCYRTQAKLERLQDLKSIAAPSPPPPEVHVKSVDLEQVTIKLEVDDENQFHSEEAANSEPPATEVVTLQAPPDSQNVEIQDYLDVKIEKESGCDDDDEDPDFKPSDNEESEDDSIDEADLDQIDGVTCLQCNIEYHKDYLKCHLDKNHPELCTLQCQFCQQFCYKETIDRHIKRCPQNPKGLFGSKLMRPPGNIKCDHCSTRFRSVFKYRNHLLEHHPDMKNVSCRYCLIQTFKGLLELHETRCSKNPNALDNTKVTIDKIEPPSNDSKVACHHCGKLVSDKGMDRHIQTHLINNKQPMICHYCDKQFFRSDRIVRHIRVMHHRIVDPKQQNVCKICKQGFSTYSTMVGHRRKEHPELYPPLKCTECAYTSPYETAIRVHLKRHQGENVKSFACDQCDKKFVTSITLKRHLGTHNQTYDFSCTICLKQFKTQFYMKRHMMQVHTEGQYSCPVCQRKFATNQNMRLHCGKQHPHYQLPPSGTVMFGKQSGSINTFVRMREIPKRKPSVKVMN